MSAIFKFDAYAVRPKADKVRDKFGDAALWYRRMAFVVEIEIVVEADARSGANTFKSKSSKSELAFRTQLLVLIFAARLPSI